MPDGTRRHGRAIWFARHTQTDWNRERRYQSRSDRPLTPFGLARAAAVARRLRGLPFSAIVSTGLERTDTLARAVSGSCPAPTMIVDERWREADHGDWEGLTYPEVVARFEARARERWADPWQSHAHGGESMAELWSRVAAAWNELRATTAGDVLVVTHATPIQLILCGLLGVALERSWTFRLDLGGITVVELDGEAVVVRTVNEVPPLVCPP